MKSLNRLIFTAVLSLWAVVSSAQRGPTYQADMAFMKGDYFDAAALYKKAFTKEKNKAKKAEIIFKTAECYRMTNDVKNQEVWYLKALKANVKEPEAIVRYADALKASGKYSEAIVQYQKFMTASPGDKRGEIGVRTCEQAQKWKDKPTRARIDNLAAVNTKYNDFGAAYSKKDHRSIIFTSSRQEAMGKANDGGTGEKFQDLFEATVDKKGKWSTPRALVAPLNSEANDGAAFLDSKGNEMYFTRCEVEKGVYGICQVYYTVRKADGWEEPKLIKLAADSFTVGQPCLSADGNQLYFVSDMKGGIGGKDIYVCDYDKSRKEWGAPRNLGPVINTPTDDMFPFLTAENTLYFSSKGHMGMGGLDIFRAKRAGNSWKTPENLKYPINTSFDDFAYVLDELNPDKGFLSSNRPSGKGGDDIYSWYLAPLTFTISGRVYDLDTKEPLAGTSIELFGSDGSSIPFKTDATGNYKFDLKPETKYKISASQKTYLNKYLEVSTVGLEQSKDFIGDFDFALRSTLRAIELPEVYYDLAKWDLRPESKKSLDGLVQILTENPTITIELGSHTDSRPIPMTNDTLSQRRAESVVAYLIKAGIQPERLVAKGYGATQPRVLDKDRGSFKKGDRLDDAFINGLATKELKEQAHQLNRRTEFRVLKTNYMDPNSTTEIVQETAPAPVISTETAVKVEVKEAPKAEEKSGPGEIYVCKKSDTYNSVAKQYSITVKDLKTVNGIKTEQIYEGMELKVEPNGDYTDYDKQFYVLEKGDDSFKTIAKKLNMKEGDLKKMNKGMADGDFRPGRRIRISGK